jgi:hypothetical protein
MTLHDITLEEQQLISGGDAFHCDPNPWQPDFIMPSQPDPIDRPGPTWPPMPGCY